MVPLARLQNWTCTSKRFLFFGVLGMIYNRILELYTRQTVCVYIVPISGDLRWPDMRLDYRQVIQWLQGKIYRILVLYRVIGYWKHGVLAYGNMIVSRGQQYKLCSTYRGDHQVIAQGLWAPPAHSPNLPSLHHHRSLEHFDHIIATFPAISPVLCSIEQRKCISRYHWVLSSICESLLETSLSATSQYLGRTGSLGIMSVRHAHAPDSSSV